MATSPSSAVNQAADKLVFNICQKELEVYNDLADPYLGLVGGPGGSSVVNPSVITTVDCGDRMSASVKSMIMPFRRKPLMGDNNIAEASGETLEMKALLTPYNSWTKVGDRRDFQSTRIGNLYGRAYFTAVAKELKAASWRIRGDYIRHSYVESYSENITTEADGGPNLSYRYNMHWYFNNASAQQYAMPVYSPNAATFLANIKECFANAGTTAGDQATIDSLQDLVRVVRRVWKTRRIGTAQAGKVLIGVGTDTWTALSKLNSVGSVAYAQKSTFSQRIAEKAWVDEAMEIPGGIVVFRDDKCPLAVYNTATQDLQIVYAGVDPVNDPRDAFVTTDTQKLFDVCSVMGADAITWAKSADMMFRDQIKDFGRLDQIAVLASEGFSLSEYDDGLQANETANSRVGQGAGIFISSINR